MRFYGDLSETTSLIMENNSEDCVPNWLFRHFYVLIVSFVQLTKEFKCLKLYINWQGKSFASHESLSMLNIYLINCKLTVNQSVL